MCSCSAPCTNKQTNKKEYTKDFKTQLELLAISEFIVTQHGYAEVANMGDMMIIVSLDKTKDAAEQNTSRDCAIINFDRCDGKRQITFS